MKVGLYICTCGTNVSATVDADRVMAELLAQFPSAYAAKVEFICSGEGKSFFKQHLIENRPDRVVVAACSPREYESTFMQLTAECGINPYSLQFVNIREQVAWVTPDPEQATRKAITAIRAAMARVPLHEPLEKKEVEACPDVLVIGAGPAGLQSALFLAEAGRKVVLVEKTPVLGGKPVLYEELFPTMECGPCLLEPVQAEVLHGNSAHNIEILYLSEVVGVTGYYGNFNVKIKQTPRRVDSGCIACGMCIEPCPATAKNEFNCGLDEKKAIAMPFLGALPNLPYIDWKTCLRSKGESCQLCADACPLPGTVRLDDQDQILERNVGAIIVAVGSSLYDCSNLPALGYKSVADVYTSLEFERLAAANGPTAGELKTAGGKAPESIAIVHCVGSLDPRHQPHCSGICCEYAFKFNRVVEHKLPETKIYHFYKELVASGKDDFSMLHHAQANPNAKFLRFRNLEEIGVSAGESGQEITYKLADGREGSVKTDMVVLCPAVVGSEDAAGIGSFFELNRNRAGFSKSSMGACTPRRAK